MSRSRYHVIVVVDVEGFGRRTDTVQKWLRKQLYRIMEEAFAEAGIAVPEHPGPHDRGDGAFWLLPGEVPKQDLTGPFIDRITAGLEEYAAVSAEEARMRLRVSLHAGEVAQDERGWVGSDLNTACRLVDAQALRDVLAAAPRAHLALIVSSQWHGAVVRHGAGGIAHGSYAPVSLGIKELRDTAWIRVPGYDSPPGLPDAGPAEDAAASAESAESAAGEPGRGGPASKAPGGPAGAEAARAAHDNRSYFKNATVNAREIVVGDQIGGRHVHGSERGR